MHGWARTCMEPLGVLNVISAACKPRKGPSSPMHQILLIAACHSVCVRVVVCLTVCVLSVHAMEIFECLRVSLFFSVPWCLTVYVLLVRAMWLRAVQQRAATSCQTGDRHSKSDDRMASTVSKKYPKSCPWPGAGGVFWKLATQNETQQTNMADFWRPKGTSRAPK